MRFTAFVFLAAMSGCAQIDDGNSGADTGTSIGTTDQTAICFADGDGDGFGFTAVSYVGQIPDGCAPAGSDCDDARPGVYPGATEIAGDGLDNDCAGGDITGDQLDADPFLPMFQNVQAFGFVDIGGGIGCVPGSWPSADDNLNIYGDGFGSDYGWQQPVDNFRSGEYFGLDQRFVCTDALSNGSNNRWSVSAPISVTDSRPAWNVTGEIESAFRRGSPYVIEIQDGGLKYNFCTRYSIFDDRILPGECAYTFVRDETPEDPYDTQQTDDDDDTVQPAGDTVECYDDTDNDNYGEGALREYAGTTCGQNLASVAGDCDDTRADVYPGRSELQNGRDDDCDGQIDEGVGGGNTTCPRDADLDGYGHSSATVVSTDGDCADPGESTNTSDCDDGDSDNNPGHAEVGGDGEDNDCDGLVDEAGGGQQQGGTINVVITLESNAPAGTREYWIYNETQATGGWNSTPCARTQSNTATCPISAAHGDVLRLGGSIGNGAWFWFSTGGNNAGDWVSTVVIDGVSQAISTSVVTQPISGQVRPRSNGIGGYDGVGIVP